MSTHRFSSRRSTRSSSSSAEPAPDAVFAVDVANDIAIGQVDRQGVRLCVPVLPEGRRHDGRAGEGLRRQGPRRLQEHGRPPAGRADRPPRELRRGQAGQVPRVQDGIAGEVGLDTGKLEADMASAECKQLVENDMQELAKFKVSSTPTFFINGRHVGGALPKDAFKQLIDEKLKIAEASGVGGADYAKEVVGKGEKQFRSKLEPKPN